ncbi:MAG: Nudix family hydrolase [Methylococcales bacterium]|nr:Nudix family hydrolase [Methylococcales bacterium]
MQIRVAVGVIKNPQGQVLIALRDDARHQGGLWEFSDGKIEVGETAEHELQRELKEELGIEVVHATRLITINHQYPDKAVQLQVFTVDQFTGEPHSAENQPMQWVNPSDLKNYALPAANAAIITAAQLPPYYAILDDSVIDVRYAMRTLQTFLANGLKLIQARLKNLSTEDSHVFIQQATLLCQQHGAILLINSAVKQADNLADGLHLTSRDLMAMHHRPALIKWLSASCHNLEELQYAQHIGVDFVVLAPVLTTQTHPDTTPLGWQQFAELVNQCNLPVYALGGQTLADLTTAQQAGGQGIAAIRAFL